LNQLTEFHEISYELHASQGHTNLLLIYTHTTGCIQLRREEYGNRAKFSVAFDFYGEKYWNYACGILYGDKP
jgi:hypothetical protein